MRISGSSPYGQIVVPPGRRTVGRGGCAGLGANAHGAQERYCSKRKSWSPPN